MTSREALLKSIASRSGRHGISTAAQCLKAFDACLDGGFCPRYAKGISGEQWQALIKEAENKLVYSAPGMNIKGAFESNSPQYAMEFNCVISSRRKDRDGDILLPDGASLDPNAPLLWQHNSLLPIGLVLGKIGQSTQKISGRCAIAKFEHDSELAELARDAATLIQCNGLRISHGFEPKDYSPMDDDEGRWLIKSYEILEVSVVSIPSNVDAIIESFSRGKLHSPIAKDWAKSFRKPQGIGVEFNGTRISDRVTPEVKLLFANGGLTVDELRKEMGMEPLPNSKGQVLVQGMPKHNCTCHQKDATAHQHESVRREGESVDDCVSRKIQILEHEGGRSHEQNIAIAEAMCRGKSKDEAIEKVMGKGDPIRWNKSLSKRFDVANEPVKPSSMGYEWAAKYLEVPVKNIFDTSCFVPSARMGSWLTAFRSVTADFNVVDIRNIQGNYESPPIYETIQLKSNLSDSFLVEGTQFFVVQGKSPLIVSIEPRWGGVQLRAFCRYAERQMVTDMFSKTWQIAKENNFLKGEAFALSGEFIPRDNINWSDVFLIEKNQKPLTRMVNNLNAKGRNCPNRGIIMMGPPGTGKTLSGRVIKNLANSTFIWISARDFHRSGAFGGFEYAFELAKELAPCVLFFEDIDNWIGRDTVDLMKTEMDGLTKSSGVITILTTNFPENLPEALVDRPGRFHEILKIDLPNDQVRKQMISKWVQGVGLEQIQKAVDRTKGYSGAHIYELAQFAKAITETDELPISEALTKALDKIDEQRDMISRNLLQGSRYQPRKDILMSTSKALNEPESSAPSSTVDPSFPYTNTTRVYEDNEGNRGQGPQQGDHDWATRHMSSQIVDELVAGLDTPEFDVDNDPYDAIFSIAQGANTGAQQNPAPDTALADNAGPKDQPGVPTPTMGVQYPMPMPTVQQVSTSPGPQGGAASVPAIPAAPPVPPFRSAAPTVKEQNVNDRQDVSSHSVDLPAEHRPSSGDVGTDVNVDVPHLKAVAATIQHSGKEGNSYLHEETGHVHHVAHPDDLHPDNAHMYHGHDEIHKLYKSVRGVKSVKVAIQQHPKKGMGYKMMYCGSGSPAGADMPMGDGTEHVSHSPQIKNLMELKELLTHAISKEADANLKRVLAVGFLRVLTAMKFSSLSPNQNGTYDNSVVPQENVLNQPSMNRFQGGRGLPEENVLNQESMNQFNGGRGLPEENVLNQESMQGFGVHAPQMNTPAANPPPGKAAEAVLQAEYVNGLGGPRENVLANPTPPNRRTDPGTMSNESVDGPNIPGSVAFRNNVLNEDEVMNWLEEVPKNHDEEFDKEFATVQVDDEFEKAFS